MTDVKRLLEAAASSPWYSDGTGVIYGNDGDEVASGTGSAAHLVDQSERAALIVYAVNRLPDYETAVDALERLLEAEHGGYGLHGQPCRCEAHGPARAALASLRESVPA